MTAEMITGSEIDRQIARNVKIAFFDTGLLQREVALKIGMHPSSLSKSIQGERPWRAEEVVLLAQVLGVSTADLLPRLDSNQQPAGSSNPQVRVLPGRHLRVVRDEIAS